MTGPITVTYCARPECGRTETSHKFRTDGWSRGGTDDGVCPGWLSGRVEERPDEGELRRRLAAVLEIHHDYLGGDSAWCGRCNEAWPCETARAARGET